jgi:hypothetical protein
MIGSCCDYRGGKHAVHENETRKMLPMNTVVGDYAGMVPKVDHAADVAALVTGPPHVYRMAEGILS